MREENYLLNENELYFDNLACSRFHETNANFSTFAVDLISRFMDIAKNMVNYTMVTYLWTRISLEVYLCPLNSPLLKRIQCLLHYT